MLLISLFLSLVPVQTTWHVDANALAPGDGSAASPYTRIDFALAQASTLSGDTVLVQSGTYMDEQIDFMGKGVHLLSVGGPGSTLISRTSQFAPVGDGTHTFVRAVSGEPAGTIIEGFRLVNGSGEDFGDRRRGGSFVVVDSQLSIIDCEVANSRAHGGGVLWGQNATVTMRDCDWSGSALWVLGGFGPPGSMGVPEYGGIVLASNSRFLVENCTLDGLSDGEQLFRQHKQGGVFRLQDCWTSLSNCSLTGTIRTTHPRHGAGGIAYVLGGGFSVRASVLHPDESYCLGGAIYARMGAFVEVNGCTVDGVQQTNYYTQGGALNLDECTAIVRSSHFKWNGGQIAAKGGESLDHGYGGAIYSLSPIEILDCVFVENVADWGGAIYASTAIVKRCTFQRNQAGGRFSGSIVSGGGGAVSMGSGLLEDCLFENNEAKPTWFHNQVSPRSSAGGAAACGIAVIRRCLFLGNVARAPLGGRAYGGALSGSPLVSDSTFVNNRVVGPGGGTSSTQGGLFGGAARLWPGASVENCVFRDNRVQHSPGVGTFGANLEGGTFINCTLVGNQSPGHGVARFATLRNCILVDNGNAPLDGASVASYSLSDQPLPGVGNMRVDPFFWSPSDFHLLPASPAIDAGDPADTPDADGTRRDMGAWAFTWNYCAAICASELGTYPCSSNTNSTGQVASILASGSATLNRNFLQLSSRHVPAGSCGYYLASQTAGFTPLFSGSNGNLCLGAHIYRLHDQILQATPAGSMARHLRATQMPEGQTLLPGSTWHFQLWYRDGTCTGGTSNTSGSVAVDFQ